VSTRAPALIPETSSRASRPYSGRGDQLHHRADVLGGAGHDLRRLVAQRGHVLAERLDVRRGEGRQVHAGLRGQRDDAVVHVGD
jgi:hypothetical protein